MVRLCSAHAEWGCPKKEQKRQTFWVNFASDFQGLRIRHVDVGGGYSEDNGARVRHILQDDLLDQLLDVGRLVSNWNLNCQIVFKTLKEKKKGKDNDEGTDLCYARQVDQSEVQDLW